MKSEREILKDIKEGKFSFPPLQFRLIGTELRSSNTTCDALLEANWLAFDVKFAAEIRRYSSDKILFEAVRQAYYVANQFDAHPLVITPWLSPEQLESLERERISAIDLSGNGIVIVPGKILIARSGKPNLFPDSRTVKNVYDGVTSLVARALLCKPDYSSVNELLNEIHSRAGLITQSTVSKALKQLEEDIVVSRDKGKIKLLQAEKLMTRLAANFQGPDLLDSVSGKLEINSGGVAQFVTSLGSRHPSSQLVVSGRSSVSKYAVMGREPIVEFYCQDDLEGVIETIIPHFDLMSRFPNVRIFLVKDPTVLFDSRLEDGIRWASPVQSYLELMIGDKREKETAEQVRKYILEKVNQDARNGQ